jgi:hypothetical protein
MIVLVTAEGLALALLAVLVAGLLRSHAEILRSLHDLGAPAAASSRGDADEPRPSRVTLRATSAGVVAPRAGTTPVFDVAGTTPFAEAISVAVGGGRVDTLLAFLSAGCTTCERLWKGLEDLDGVALPDRTRVVVVTVGPGEESPAHVRRVAPRSVPVVMSSEAWQDYRVPGAPYFILVDGPARSIRGEGSAGSWAEVASLLCDATGDGGRRGSDGPAREARIDRELAAAGILPGDPRLHQQPASVPGQAP